MCCWMGEGFGGGGSAFFQAGAVRSVNEPPSAALEGKKQQQNRKHQLCSYS